MFIKQLSIFVENKPGRLHSIMDALSENGVDISALSIADTTDFGILRIIVSDIDKAREVLREIGVISKVTNVIAVYIDHKIGGLAAVLDHISDAGIGIEYMYAFLGRTEGKALMVLKADDEEMAAEVLSANGVKLASMEEI
ncbi:MAG: ACT domain-containing protein [Clostridia bacterium]|nr:ACT domain-containing protein [Clostridia bacterium]MBQ2237776.1 ACT domain-containing protein [Clostridia bacterium]MEE1185623.1 acetolactate synthase [Acutalibacteraceae bacterium]